MKKFRSVIRCNSKKDLREIEDHQLPTSPASPTTSTSSTTPTITTRRLSNHDDFKNPATMKKFRSVIRSNSKKDLRQVEEQQSSASPTTSTSSTTPTITTRRLSHHDDLKNLVKQNAETNDTSQEEKSNQEKKNEQYRQPIRKEPSTNLVVTVVPPQQHQEDAYVQFSPSMDTSEQHRMPPSLSTLPRLTPSELKKENKLLQRQNQILQQQLQKQQKQQQHLPIKQDVKHKKPRKKSSPALNQKQKESSPKHKEDLQRRLAEEEQNSLLKESNAILRHKMESLEERIIHLTKLSLQQSTSIANDYSSLKQLSNPKLMNNNKKHMDHKQNSLTSILTAATDPSTAEESNLSHSKNPTNNEEKNEYYDDVTCSSSNSSSLYLQKLQRDSIRMAVAKKALLSVVDQQESTLKEYRKLAEPRFQELQDSRFLIQNKRHQLRQLKKTIEMKQKNALIQQRTEESLERQLYYLQKMYLQKRQDNLTSNHTNTKKRIKNTGILAENEHDKFLSYYNTNFHRSESELFSIQKQDNKKVITSSDSWDVNPAVTPSSLSSDHLKEQKYGYSQSSLCFSSTSEASFEQQGKKPFSNHTPITSSSSTKNPIIQGQHKYVLVLLLYPREEQFELVSVSYFCEHNKSNYDYKENDDDDDDASRTEEAEITNTTPSMQKLLDTVADLSEHIPPYKQERQTFRAFCTSHTELLLSNFLTLESYHDKISEKDVFIAIPETMQKRECISQFKRIFHSPEVQKAYKRILNVHRHQQQEQHYDSKDEKSVTCEIMYIGRSRMSHVKTSFSSCSSLDDEIYSTEKSVIDNRKKDHDAIISSSPDDLYNHFISTG